MKPAEQQHDMSNAVVETATARVPAARRPAAQLVAASILCASLAPTAKAALIDLGTATGGLMTVYNNLDTSGAQGSPDDVVSGYDENPDNQAYVKAQYSYDNTNGMGFQFADDSLSPGGVSFNDIFSGQPFGTSQFGLDLYSPSLTYDSTGGVTLPTIEFRDYLGGGSGSYSSTSASDGSTQAWAINDYKFGSPIGPENESNVNHNSLFRGTAFTINLNDFRIVQDVGPNKELRDRFYDIDVSGTLVTDGLIHWFGPDLGTTPLAAWGLSDTFLFEGTLRYDAFYAAQDADPRGVPAVKDGLVYNGSVLENGSDQQDFYFGSLQLSAQTLEEVPAPGGIALFVAGLIGLRLGSGRRRQKKLA
ncbi:MAG: hypothetical protein ACX93N_07810 [Pseudohaliea sp.]